MIQKIDVTYSEEVTNACISYLFLCMDLKNVELSDSYIDKYCYKKLAKDHSCLEIIDYTTCQLFWTIQNNPKF